MSSMRKIAAVLALTLWAAVGSAHAQVAGVFPVQGTNLTEGEAAAIGVLIASAYAQQIHIEVLAPNALAAVLQATGSERASAQQLGLREYIHVQAVHLEKRTSLHAELRNPWGSLLFEVRDTALSLDDMELVAQRIAASLARRTALENTRTLDNVTLGEARAPNRVFLEKLFGARFALVMPFARHLESQASLLLQFDTRLEQENCFLELAAGFWLPSETNSHAGLGGFLGHLGGSYYLMHESVSPYVGLGISPRVFLGEYAGPGLAVNAHVGVMFMREASTRLYAEVRVDQNLIKAQRETYDYTASGTTRVAHDVLPTELSIAVGLGF